MLIIGKRKADGPVNLSPPTATTTGKIGSPVTGANGSWSGATSFTYEHQFFNDFDEIWEPMPGETSINIAALSSEFNLKQGRLAVTASGPGGSVTAFSAPYDITYVAPVITNVGSITGTGKIGGTLTHTGLVVDGEGWVPVREWRVNGVAVPGAASSNLFAPEGVVFDGASVTCFVTATNSGGSDTDETAGVTMTYNAPTSAGNLAPVSIPEDAPANAIDFSAQVTVIGDDDLSGCTWSVQSGSVPAGMSRTGGVVFGTPTTPTAASTLTLRCTNSGGFVDVSCSITITAAGPGGFGSNLITNGTFDGASVANWNPANNAELIGTGDQLTIESGGSSNAQARQGVSVTGGVTYRVWAKFVGGTAAGTHAVRLGTSAGSTNIGNLTTSTGTVDGARHYLDVTPSTTGLMHVAATNPSNVLDSTAIFDDIEIREILSGVPADFTPSDWTLINAGSVNGNVLTLTIGTWAAGANGADYRIGASGQWVNTGLSDVGSINITCPQFETATTIYLRARAGSTPSVGIDSKTATPHFATSCRFVQAVGGNNANTGLWGSPWQTSVKAGQSAAAGQTIYFRPGAYTPFSLSNSGTAGNHIVFTTLPGEQHQAVISGSGTGSQLSGGFNAVGKSYFEVRNLRFESIGGAGIACFGDNGVVVTTIIIDNNQIDTTSNAGIYCAGKVMTPANTTPPDEWKMTNLTITRNDVTNTNFSTGTNECITVGNGTDTFEIAFNDVHDSQQYGIDAKLGARNGKIHHNRVWNMEKHAIYMDAACRFLHNIDIHDNECWDCGSNGCTLAREAARGNDHGHFQDIDDIRLYNNFFHQCERGLLIYKHINDPNDILRLNYDGATATDFDVGEQLVGQISGARRTIVRHIPLTSTTGTLYLRNISGKSPVNNSISYQNNEPITCSGASAQANGTGTTGFAGRISNVKVAHCTFADSNQEDVELNSSISPIVSNFAIGNCILSGGGQSNQFGFSTTTGYANGGNLINTNPGFANRTTSPPDLRIGTGTTADGAGSPSFLPSAILGAPAVTDIDLDGNPYDPVAPTPGCYEAA